MGFTFADPTGDQFLATQDSGVAFVLTKIKEAGDLVGFVLQYPTKSDTFRATFRAPESEVCNLAAGSPLRKPSARSLGIPGRAAGERRSTIAVLSTARNSADDLGLTPESRQGTCTAIESIASGERRRTTITTAVLSTARDSSDDLDLIPESRNGTVYF